MALGNLYVDAYQNDVGLIGSWIVNWPPNSPVAIGDVGRLVEDRETSITGFSKGSTLSDHGIQVETDSTSPAGGLFLTVGKETKVDFGFDAETPGFEWLGDASAGFKASFGSSGGLQADAENLRQSIVVNIDALKPKLLDAYFRGSLSLGHAIVVEKETADRGMIIASESQSADLKVFTNAAIAPAKAPLAKFAANFSVYSNSGGALTQPMEKRFTVAYRTLVVGTQGFWWWRRVDIKGAVDLTDSEKLLAIESGLNEDDYFARF